MKLKVALLQIGAAADDEDQNLACGIHYCRQAKPQGAELVVFPELWNIGCAPCPLTSSARQKWEASAIDCDGRFFQQFAAVARELDLNIAVTYLEKHTGKPRNSVSIIDGTGRVVLTYSKTFICNFGLEELEKPDPNVQNIGCDHNCSPGESFDVATLRTNDGDVKVGAMICSDREFPEPGAELFFAGAELIVVPNACQWDELRSSILRARAFENFAVICMANYPAPQANWHSQAVTCVAWKQGRELPTVIVEAGAGEGIVMADIDIAAVRDFRAEEAWRLEHRRKWRASRRCF
jgi:predicted amidohydrolase